MDQKSFIKAVNQKFDLPGLLRALRCRVDMVPTTLRCPFHEDNSKSAKLFEDNRLYCFTCHKQYGSYDALQLLGVSDADIKRKLSKMGVVVLDPDKEFVVDEESAKILKTKYRLGEITLGKMLDGLYLLISHGGMK